MDSHKLLRFSVPGADLSYEFSPTDNSLSSEWMLGSMKFDLESSPDSPLSIQFDVDTFSTLSNSQEQYSSTENLSAISPSYNSSLEIDSSFQRSPPNLHQSLQLCSGGSSVSQDAVCSPCMKHALQELETALLGPDTDEATTPSTIFDENKHSEVSEKQSGDWVCASSQGSLVVAQEGYTSSGSKNRRSDHGDQPEKRHRAIKDTFLTQIPKGDVRQLLTECARAISENELGYFKKLVPEVRKEVSISGEPIQRLGAYMLEGLVARTEASGSNIYRALKCKEPESKELLSYMHILYEICPYFKFGYMAANGAIAEAFKNEDRVHIIDFQIALGTQWVTLIQALAARPSGPPRVRITGIDDPVSKYARGEGLEAVGRRLAELSKKYNIPLEFHPVPVFASDVRPEMLDVRPDEALAVNFTLQLHHTPDESVDVNNPRDGLLRMVKALRPKVTTLVEQESNTNTAPFFQRFKETLGYYSAMFESIDVTLARDNKQRINVEQHCLARDIVNIIACEGPERVERHELLGKWRSRFSMADFSPYPLSSYVNSVISSLLRSYSENYTLSESDGSLLLGWKNRNLISASAWH